MILSVSHITKAFLEVPVLSDISFHLEKGDRAAIVGINGAGKTTLLKIIIGEMEPDSGTVAFSHDTTIGYLAQNQNLDSTSTIYEELLTVRQDMVDMEQRIAVDEKLMEQLSGPELDRVIEEYNDLLSRFQRENGYSYRGEITGILRGLGFSEPDFTQRISTLSGGQKTRVALAKILLEKPDIVILDEPTNHLDIAAIRWLETYLANYRGTVLIVSHDRYFLDKTASQIIEIENTHATVFHGNYTFYADRKKALRDQAWHQYLNNQAEIRHQEEVITKLKQFNREKSIKRAESREKALSKMEHLEKPVELRDDMHLVLKPCIRSGRDVMDVRHLAKSFEEKHLFSDITFDLKRGEHAAIIGSNGTGKSTLLKIIIGQIRPDAGSVRFGTNVHIGYYDQEHHVLNDENTVFEEISDAHPDMTNTDIRNLLASFLFTGEDVFKRIADLSGGEKGRVSLAKLMLSEANFLILDEPTNHLDMTSREVLENALNSYEGTVLFVSHDRYFINRTASRILSLTDRMMLDYPGSRPDAQAPDCYIGNYDYYLQKSQEAESALKADEVRRIQKEALVRPPEKDDDAPDNASTKKAVSGAGTAFRTEDDGGNGSPADGEVTESGAEGYRQQKKLQAERRKRQNQLKKCEEDIQKLEDRNRAIDEEMALPENGTDLPRLEKLQNEKTGNEEQLELLYEQWETLQEE